MSRIELVLLTVSILSGCELITAVDRRLIPDDETVGAGGNAGGSGGTSSASSTSSSNSTSSSSTSSSSSSNGEEGGSGGQGGNTGGSGGSGGTGCVGDCCSIESDEVAIEFMAPADHSAGLIGISGWLECPNGSVGCQSITYTSPVANSVAPSGDMAIAHFGIRPAGTTFRGLGTLHATATSEAIGYFVVYQGSTPIRQGTYVACRGKLVVGGYEDGTFFGVCSATDETGSPNNIMCVFP